MSKKNGAVKEETKTWQYKPQSFVQRGKDGMIYFNKNYVGDVLRNSIAVEYIFSLLGSLDNQEKRRAERELMSLSSYSNYAISVNRGLVTIQKK